MHPSRHEGTADTPLGMEPVRSRLWSLEFLLDYFAHDPWDGFLVFVICGVRRDEEKTKRKQNTGKGKTDPR